MKGSGLKKREACNFEKSSLLGLCCQADQIERGSVHRLLLFSDQIRRFQRRAESEGFDQEIDGAYFGALRSYFPMRNTNSPLLSFVEILKPNY
tara:strand:+ start:333 stop:611 length:279 start_codon:yes stop_codon:yes gene_type:complete